jgi:hypothetical protein
MDGFENSSKPVGHTRHIRHAGHTAITAKVTALRIDFSGTLGAIRSYLSTAAKHGRNFFDTLVMLAEGRPWLPETT